MYTTIKPFLKMIDFTKSTFFWCIYVVFVTKIE